MELFSDPITLGVLVLVCGFAGFVDSIAGGGGLLTVPALLWAGIPPHLALGTNKLISTQGTLGAALTFMRKGLFNPKQWWLCGVLAFFGSVVGAVAVTHIDQTIVRKIIPFAVLCMAIYFLIPQKKAAAPAQEQMPSVPLQMACGSTLGFYDGFLGPGTGSFWVMLTMSVFRLDIVRASGVARCMNLMSNLGGLLMFAYLGKIYWLTGMLLGAANIVGNLLGAHSAIRFGSQIIRPMVICISLAMSVKLLFWG